MTERETKKIEIPEICRVEGHSAVTVDIEDGKVVDVKLDVFEGTRFFERIVVGHKYDEISHITSRVCAICSTGHILAAIHAIERICDFTPTATTRLYRELMHLGMIIESHATHICALALPDFLGTPDLLDFASRYHNEFEIWTQLRNLGASIQTVLGGRPFHPVNLFVGGFSRYPDHEKLRELSLALESNMERAVHLCDLLTTIKLPFAKTAPCRFAALIPQGNHYGFFGEEVATSDGETLKINDYRQYLSEKVVSYSHAKQSMLGGQPVMVGSMARLFLFFSRLGKKAKTLYQNSQLVDGLNANTIWNSLAQAIEIVEALDRAKAIIKELLADKTNSNKKAMEKVSIKAGGAAGAVECPRGTLYHYYELDADGKILAADMITPSAQNTARIEHDIRLVVEEDGNSPTLEKDLETLVRAYDPCNTCATHMVTVRYAKST